MTIATTSNKATWQGNGAATVFPFNFEVGSVSQITLTLTAGGSVTTIPSSSYTASGLGSPGGGTITYPLSGSPIPTGSVLTLVRTVPLQQLTDLINQSNYFPDAVEGALDYEMMALQQISGQVAQSLQTPQSDPPLNLIFPSSSARSNTIAGFDPSGNVTTYPISASIGAGDMTVELGAGGTPGFKAGVDFVAGTTTTLNLSKAYGSVANVFVAFDGTYQAKGTYQIVGTQIIFNAPIPSYTQNVDVVGGTTLSLYVPPNGSVGDAQLQWGGILWRVCDSVTALRALPSANYQKAFLSGYYTAGDKGGGPFYFNASDTTSADNGWTIIVASDGGRWYRITAGMMLDPFGMGAKADNTTDNSAQLQTLFSTGLNGYRIPAGQYKFGTGLANDYSPTTPPFPNPGEPSARADIRGDSMANTILNFSGTGYAITLTGDNNTGSGQGIHSLDKYSGFTIQDFAQAQSNSGISMTNRAWWKLEDIVFNELVTGLNIDSCYSAKVATSYFNQCQYGIQLNTTALGPSNEIDFDSLVFQNCSLAGVLGVSIGTNCMFRNFSFESCGTMGNNATGGFIGNLSGVYGYTGPITFDNPYAENNAGLADISLDNPSTHAATVKIRGGLFQRVSNSNYVQSNISVTSSGTGPVTVILEDCNFVSGGSYEPSASRPFWVGGPNVTFVDGGGNTWNETTSIVTPLAQTRPRVNLQFTASTATINVGTGATITRNAAGDYTANYSSQLVFPNVVYQITPDGTGQNSDCVRIVSQTTSGFRFNTVNQSGTLFDPTTVSLTLWGM
jgi:hypothetical protein